MNRIEKIKKILLEFRQEIIKHPQNTPVEIYATVELNTSQICQLFKPERDDECRFLRDFILIEVCNYANGTEKIEAVIDHIIAKTASNLKTQEQARIERIFKEIEDGIYALELELKVEDLTALMGLIAVLKKWEGIDGN